MLNEKDKLERLVQKFVKTNYAETIYRAFYVIRLSKSLAPTAQEEARKILNTNIDKASRIYYNKCYPSIPALGPQSAFLMNKSGKLLGLLTQRLVAFDGKFLYQVQSKGKGKQVTKPVSFTQVLPIEPRYPVPDIGKKPKKQEVRYQPLSWVDAKEVKFRVVLYDQKDKSVKAVYCESYETAINIRDKCLCVLLTRDWDLTANSFFRYLSFQYYEQKVAKALLARVRSLAQMEMARKLIVDIPETIKFSDQTEKQQKPAEVRSAESEQLQGINVVNQTVESEIITLSKLAQRRQKQMEQQQNQVEDEGLLPNIVIQSFAKRIQSENSESQKNVFKPPPAHNTSRQSNVAPNTERQNKLEVSQILPREKPVSLKGQNQSKDLQVLLNRFSLKKSESLADRQLDMLSDFKPSQRHHPQKTHFAEDEQLAHKRTLQQLNISKITKRSGVRPRIQRKAEKYELRLLGLDTHASRMAPGVIELKVNGQPQFRTRVELTHAGKNGQMCLFQCKSEPIAISFDKQQLVEVLVGKQAYEIRTHRQLLVPAGQTLVLAGQGVWLSLRHTLSKELDYLLQKSTPWPFYSDRDGALERILKQYVLLNSAIFFRFALRSIDLNYFRAVIEYGLPLYERTQILARFSNLQIFDKIADVLSQRGFPQLYRQSKARPLARLQSLFHALVQATEKECNFSKANLLVKAAARRSKQSLYPLVKRLLQLLVYCQRLVPELLVLSEQAVALCVSLVEMRAMTATLQPCPEPPILQLKDCYQWFIVLSQTLGRNFLSPPSSISTNSFLKKFTEEVFVEPETKVKVYFAVIKQLLRDDDRVPLRDIDQAALKFYNSMCSLFADCLPAPILVNLWNYAVVSREEPDYFLLSLGLWLSRSGFDQFQEAPPTNELIAEVVEISNKYFTQPESFMSVLHKYILPDIFSQARSQIVDLGSAARGPGAKKMWAAKSLKQLTVVSLNRVLDACLLLQKDMRNPSQLNRKLSKLLLQRQLSFTANRDQLHIIFHELGYFGAGYHKLLIRYGEAYEQVLSDVLPHFIFKRSYSELELQFVALLSSERFYYKVEVGSVKRNTLLTERVCLKRLGGNNLCKKYIVLSVFKGDPQQPVIIGPELGFGKVCQLASQQLARVEVFKVLGVRPSEQDSLTQLFSQKGFFNLAQFLFVSVLTFVNTSYFNALIFKFICLLSSADACSLLETVLVLSEVCSALGLPVYSSKIRLMLHPLAYAFSPPPSEQRTVVNVDGQERIPQFSQFFGSEESEASPSRGQSQRLATSIVLMNEIVQFCKGKYSAIAMEITGLVPSITFAKFNQFMEDYSLLLNFRRASELYEAERNGQQATSSGTELHPRPPVPLQYEERPVTYRNSYPSQPLRLLVYDSLFWSQISLPSKLSVMLKSAINRHEEEQEVTDILVYQLHEFIERKALQGNIHIGLKAAPEENYHCEALTYQDGTVTWRSSRLCQVVEGSKKGKPFAILSRDGDFVKQPLSQVRDLPKQLPSRTRNSLAEDQISEEAPVRRIQEETRGLLFSNIF